ncbi:MAG TPA: hypothetical protein PK702_10080 [Burkholderiaceae bacterium]|nr:hypothetical protein [Burkholderiaceae bacterium]
MNKSDRKIIEKVVRILPIVIILLAPIAVYVCTFGIKISDDHTRWSEMGSAISGIYTPILTLLTLIVLVSQVRMQNEMNKHIYDQTFIDKANDDIQFNLLQLERELSKQYNNFSYANSLQNELMSVFCYASVDDLAKQDLALAAERITKSNPHILNFWTAIYTNFAGLSEVNDSAYTNSFIFAKRKVSTLLTYECCVSLDNYTWCLQKNRVFKKYEYSQELNKVRQD